MSFIQDLGNFIGEVKAVGDELDTTKREIVATVADSTAQVKTTLSDTAAAITTTAQQASNQIKQSTTIDIQSQPESPDPSTK